MNISDNNFKKLKIIINELLELSNKLPDIPNNIVNTNINYRAFILNQWIENPSKDIDYYINSNKTENPNEYKQCADCGKLLKYSELKPHNKYEQYNDVFCNECLDTCSICGVLFADYTDSGKCDRCAD